jgi:hypothetical protein
MPERERGHEEGLVPLLLLTGRKNPDLLKPNGEGSGVEIGNGTETSRALSRLRSGSSLGSRFRASTSRGQRNLIDEAS